MEISFIRMLILVHLHVNKTIVHMKGFTAGLAFKQRQRATRKWTIPVRLRFLHTLDAISDKLTQMWPTFRGPSASKRDKLLEKCGKPTGRILAVNS